MYIGICESEDLVFEGNGTYGAQVVWPRPLLMPAKLISSISLDSELVPARIDATVSSEYLFREDDFDFVTRIRRGRFYKRRQIGQPENWTVMVSPPLAADSILLNKRGVSFEPISYSELNASGGRQRLVVLGADQSFSVWTITNEETTHTREIFVTLKARKSFGALPQVDWNLIPDKSGLVREKIESLHDDIFRAGAESVVDRAREAATAILSSYLQSEGVADASGKDLGVLNEMLDKRNGKHGQRIVRCAAEIPQRLHSRAKHAEQEKHDEIRPICEQDAELAVQCVGVMLCDLGWARWN